MRSLAPQSVIRDVPFALGGALFPCLHAEEGTKNSFNQNQRIHLALQRAHRHDAFHGVCGIRIDPKPIIQMDFHAAVEIRDDELEGAIAEAQKSLCLDESARLSCNETMT